MTVYERIKLLADQKKISLQKVATDLGFSENYVYNLRYKKSPSVGHLAKISDYFGVTLDYLVGRENNYSKQEVVDIVELANQPLDYDWNMVISAAGKPLAEEDKSLIRRLFANKK